MTKITLLGVDPGLIDTGVACVTLDPVRKEWSRDVQAFRGQNTADIVSFIEAAVDVLGQGPTHVWVEKWRERGMVTAESQPMRELERDIKIALPEAKFLENMGVKKLVSNRLLAMFDLLNVQATNHRDIQAAARIMLLGAIKDEALNLAVYLYVTDALDGKPWKRVTA